MKKLYCGITIAVVLLVSVPVIGSAQTISGIDAIQDAQTKAGSIRAVLTRLRDRTPTVIDSMARIDGLGEKDLRTSVSNPNRP